ncbi:hypothetical protein JCM11641_004960 [Rhodosporidiobolus odoratus]
MSSHADNHVGAGVDGLPVYPRLNVFGSTLLPAPVSTAAGHPDTGFFRNNYCDASPMDPGSHTVAAVVGKDFLEFSKSQGNDLTPLFPSLFSSSPSPSSPSSPTPPCVWCLCASRWLQALQASSSHPLGEKIVPRLVLEATHERALKEKGGVLERRVVEEWGVGGDGEGRVEGMVTGTGGGGQVGGKGGDKVGR